MKNRNLKHSDNWETPKELYDKLNEEFDFNFDPCPINHDTNKWNGLEIDWKERNFINPPYSRKLKEAFVKKAIALKMKSLIVSSDKDLMQLVQEDVSLYDPMKNIYQGYDEVIDKFGVPPSLVVDVQSLAGDSSDNIPGVPGIGLKIAAQLIRQSIFPHSR